MCYKRFFLISLLLIASQQAMARCNPHLFDKQPEIPKIDEASFDDMQTAQNEANVYIAKVQKDISCVRDVRRYNAGVKRLNKYAKHVNTEMLMYNSYAGIDEQIDMITITGR